MRFIIAGGTGFIGETLCRRLLEAGHSLTILTRKPVPAAVLSAKKWATWDARSPGPWEETLEGADGVVNLAGEPIAARRWTREQKKRIRESRINATRALVNAIAQRRRKPKLLLNASAVGYYGPRGDEIVTEESGPGNDFLGRVCHEWEQEATKAESSGAIVIRLRTGIVLGRDGGALAKMVPPFKFYVGGPLGSGKQWVPWIHLDDEVGLIQFLLENSGASGAVNATAPNPVRMKEFSDALGRVLRRPSWAPVPGFALRLLLGEMADMLLTGQQALPAQARKRGYGFRYSALEDALQACIPI
ncbi:MAG: TIGR01777 family protein [Deltaproteobacteria bacterium]|nr:TIGR01777 family protein [Deltaproteobacteria bacterium]